MKIINLFEWLFDFVLFNLMWPPLMLIPFIILWCVSASTMTKTCIRLRAHTVRWVYRVRKCHTKFLPHRYAPRYSLVLYGDDGLARLILWPHEIPLELVVLFLRRQWPKQRRHKQTVRSFLIRNRNGWMSLTNMPYGNVESSPGTWSPRATLLSRQSDDLSTWDVCPKQNDWRQLVQIWCRTIWRRMRGKPQ